MSIDYTSVMITAMFTGIGSATGMALFEVFIKEKLHTVGKKIKDIPNKKLDVQYTIPSKDNSL